MFRRRRRPTSPLLFRIARAARWPTAFLVLCGAAVLALGAGIWRPLYLVAIALWVLATLAAVLDARLRGRHGLLAGVAVATGGPLVATAIARSTRREVRKVGPQFRAALPIAVIFAAAAVVVSYSVATRALDELAFTAEMPGDAMNDRIGNGERVLVSRALLGGPDRGELVAIGHFDTPGQLLGGGRVAAIGRVLGLAGEWIGASETGLYVCVEPPDITRPITKETIGCQLQDETSYAIRRTQSFGPVEIPAEHVFVLGDNRSTVRDSRTFGAVPIRALQGRVVATLWPPGRFAIL